MYYTVYRTVNNIDGMIYIGKHITNDPNDSYLGSGNRLNNAIKKYGRENFVKEVLHIFDNESDMNAKEAELVTLDFCLNEDNYNICVGGQGGWSYTNHTKLNLYGMNGRTPNCRDNLSKGWNRERSIEEREKLSNSIKKKYSDGTKFFHEKNHSEETKKKIGAKNSIAQSGYKNSQYGSMWITNGSENKKIKNVDIIPEGWYKGRK